MTTIVKKRPRDVNAWRAAAILYGDWGTSKAYVIGLAFALAGFSSFWYLLALSLLTCLVAICYIFICKAFPSGGGVYASVRSRSKVLALVGAFFLISDYLVTAALSAVSAFHYLSVPYPEYWAIASIGIIGFFNFLGPKHSGSLAILLAVPTLIVVLLLSALSLPFLPAAVHHLKPMSLDIMTDWGIFVGIIVALSGVESIANTTGSMKLDPGSTEENPSVTKTATPALTMVMLEVCILTALLGLAMNALPGLTISDGDVNAPGYPHVRDAMLRYMGDIFAGTLFGPAVGHVFAYVVMIVIAFLLLSAVNTALIALISLLFIMSKDGELPQRFQKLNRFGNPIWATVAAFVAPMAIVLFVSDIAGLANLYAIGFVGAIAVNLVSTGSNFKLPLKTWQRLLMLFTFVIMALIEITLFVDKPQARNFVVAVMGFGLLLRALAEERKGKALAPIKRAALPVITPQHPEGIMVAVMGVGKALDYALEEAQATRSPLYILFVREQRVVTDDDRHRDWTEDKDACEVFDYLVARAPQLPADFLYTITPLTAQSIVEIAKEKKVKQVIIGRKRGKFNFLNVVRDITTREIARLMPQSIDLVAVF